MVKFSLTLANAKSFVFQHIYPHRSRSWSFDKIKKRPPCITVQVMKKVSDNTCNEGRTAFTSKHQRERA